MEKDYSPPLVHWLGFCNCQRILHWVVHRLQVFFFESSNWSKLWSSFDLANQSFFSLDMSVSPPDSQERRVFMTHVLMFSKENYADVWNMFMQSHLVHFLKMDDQISNTLLMIFFSNQMKTNFSRVISYRFFSMSRITTFGPLSLWQNFCRVFQPTLICS